MFVLSLLFTSTSALPSVGFLRCSRLNQPFSCLHPRSFSFFFQHFGPSSTRDISLPVFVLNEMLSESYILEGLRRACQWSSESLVGSFADVAQSLEKEIEAAKTTVDSACRTQHVLLYGLPGCGKSTLTNVLCSRGSRLLPEVSGDSSATMVSLDIGVGNLDENDTSFVVRLPPHWLDRASHWHFLRRLEEKEQEKELEVAFESVVFGADQVIINMKQYTTRIRNHSNVTIYWHDGSSNQMTVRKVVGKKASLEFTGGGDSRSRLHREEHIKLIQLNRADEYDIFSWPQQKYLAAYMHGVEPPSPFHSTLLQLPFPESLSVNGQSWWWESTIRSSTSIDAEQHPSFAELNESQQSALRLTDAQRITIIGGPPGSGKTRTIAAEVVRSVHRTGKTTTAQRVLCLAETNTAARHMCEAIAQFLPPSQVQLLVSNEFEYEWHSTLYDDLVQRGYMEQLDRIRAERDRRKQQAGVNQKKLHKNPVGPGVHHRQVHWSKEPSQVSSPSDVDCRRSQSSPRSQGHPRVAYAASNRETPIVWRRQAAGTIRGSRRSLQCTGFSQQCDRCAVHHSLSIFRRTDNAQSSISHAPHTRSYDQHHFLRRAVAQPQDARGRVMCEMDPCERIQ